MSDTMSGMTMAAAAVVPAATITAPTAANIAAKAVVQSGITPHRSGLYTGFTKLSSSYLQANGIKVLFKCLIPGDKRGMEGQALTVPSVKQYDGTTCGMLFANSMSNDVTAFDLDNEDPMNPGFGRVIWQRRVGNPILNDAAHDMYKIQNPWWGSLSCGYIDLKTSTWYLTAFHSADGSHSFATGSWRLHALDLATGADKCPPLDLGGVTYTSVTGATIKHNESPRKQRSGLAFYSYNNGATDVIFIADSTWAMMGNAAHGFVIAVDVTGVRTGKPTVVSCAWTASSPPYAGAGIWMAGMAPSITPDGHIYVVGANGAYDPTKGCFGNAAVKLEYTPATSTAAATLKPITYQAFYTDAGRAGKGNTIPWIGLVGNYAGQMDGSSMTAPNDQDLGCAQGVYYPKSLTGFSKNIFDPCGKDGVSYGLDADNLGNAQIGDFATDKIQANYNKALWITGATYYPGAFNIRPSDLSQFSTTYGGYTHHQHSCPPWYVSPDHGVLTYYGGENGTVRVFNQSEPTPGTFTSTYIGEGAEVASPNEGPPGGMPGWFMSLSQCGAGPNNTAILWAAGPLGDANKEVVPGRLVAYGANWIAPGGNLIKLWDSQAWGWQYSHCKFGRITPCVDSNGNDRVILPTYDAQVWVLG
jgi:hypothetical protein